MFKRRRFSVEIILLCVRWYCKYGISYRDLREIMQERGVEVDASTIMRWVHRYAPELEKRVRWYQGYRVSSWRGDETYVKVGGKWKGSVATIRPGQGMFESLPCRRRQAGWRLSVSPKTAIASASALDTDAEGAFHNARFAADVSGEIEDGRLTLA